MFETFKVYRNVYLCTWTSVMWTISQVFSCGNHICPYVTFMWLTPEKYVRIVHTCILCTIIFMNICNELYPISTTWHWSLYIYPVCLATLTGKWRRYSIEASLAAHVYLTWIILGKSLSLHWRFCILVYICTVDIGINNLDIILNILPCGSHIWSLYHIFVIK